MSRTVFSYKPTNPKVTVVRTVHIVSGPHREYYACMSNNLLWVRLYAFSSCSGGWPEGGREINVHETRIVVRDKKAYRIKVRGCSHSTER